MWTFFLACEKGARVERGEIERKSDRGKTTAKHEMSLQKAVDVPLSVPFQVAGHGELCLSFVGFSGESFFTLLLIYFSFSFPRSDLYQTYESVLFMSTLQMRIL